MSFFLVLANSRPGITTYCWGSGLGLIASRVPGWGGNSARFTNSHFSILSCTLLGIEGSPAPTHAFYNLAPSPSSLGINDSRAAPVNDEELVTSATWFDLATVGLITGSVVVDEDVGIRDVPQEHCRSGE